MLRVKDEEQSIGASMQTAIEISDPLGHPSSSRRAAACLNAQSQAPVTVIERQPAWRLVDFAELWRYRELLVFLTWRDIKVRYKQTVLGAAWAVLQPFGTMLVFSLFLGRLMNAPTPVPYPLFVFAGLLPWCFFSGAVSSAGQSIVSSERLVTKVYFPRLFIPASAVAAGLVDFVIASSMLLAMMFYFGVTPSLNLLLVPLLFSTLLVAALAAGVLLSALTVTYRDFRYVVPFLLQLWMFLTPGIYMQTDGVIDPRCKLALPLNPVHGLIVNFRQAVLGGPLDLYSLGVSCAVSVALLVLSCAYFQHTERSFADVI